MKTKIHDFVEDPITPRFCKECGLMKYDGDHPTKGAVHMFWNDDRDPDRCMYCAKEYDHAIHDETDEMVLANAREMGWLPPLEEPAAAPVAGPVVVAPVVVSAPAAKRGRPKKERQARTRSVALVQIGLDESLAGKVDDFWHGNRFTSRPAAVKWLVEWALAQRPEVERG